MQTLQNHFLLAMPSLTDLYFERSLVYLCEHSSEGAMGLVVNIPVDMSLDAIVAERKKVKLVLKHLLNAQRDQPAFFFAEEYEGGVAFEDRRIVLNPVRGRLGFPPVSPLPSRALTHALPPLAPTRN